LRVFQLIRLYFSEDKDLFHAIKNIFGFYPGNIFLYKLAFRHKSAAEEIREGTKISNERLEYLGDAILSAIVADFLFKKFPYHDEGFLTEMRSKIVSRSSLNKLSLKLGIDNLILANKESNSHFKSLKGDTLEAFIGAIYIDKGYVFTRKIIIERIINVHFDIDELMVIELNFKSKLIEWVQKEKKSIDFKVIEEIGTGYNKQYVVEVLIDNTGFGKGQDFSIKGAEQIAAEKTCLDIIPDFNT